MTNAPTGNLKTLMNAGYKFKLPLPKEYQEVVDGLSAQEVDQLIEMKSRLDKAEAGRGPGVQPYSEHFLHPPF
jgi:hypothetical protein